MKSIMEMIVMDMNSLKYGVFSFIVPGLGQYLNEDKQQALTLFGIAVLLHIFIWFFMNNPLGSAVQTLYHMYASYDAFKKY